MPDSREAAIAAATEEGQTMSKHRLTVTLAVTVQDPDDDFATTQEAEDWVWSLTMKDNALSPAWLEIGNQTVGKATIVSVQQGEEARS